VAGDAVLNANYLLRSLEDVLDAPFADSGPCMHEAIFSDRLCPRHQHARSSQGLIDEGFHPMTMYFPLVVHGAMLIEPTETESKASLDEFIGALRSIAERARAGDQSLKAAPVHAPRRRPRRDARGPQAAARLPRPSRPRPRSEALGLALAPGLEFLWAWDQRAQFRDRVRCVDEQMGREPLVSGFPVRNEAAISLS
jgi:glycine dehydrogenase subunit 2